MNKKIIIVVPMINNKGPVKGAIANYHLLTKLGFDCTIVTLKGIQKDLNFRGDVLDLSGLKSLIDKKKFFDEVYRDVNPVVYSFCFSADVFSILLKSTRFKISSVRANNYKNYFYDYGYIGLALALFHHMILNFFDKVTCLSDSMKKQVSKLIINKGKVVNIGNFIDDFDFIDMSVVDFDDDVFNLIYVGNINKRKRVDLILSSLLKYSHENLVSNKISHPLRLHVIGGGDALEDYKSFANSNNLDVIFYGEIPNPLAFISKSDLMLLPSMSEGISRAVLESLALSVPVLIRNVDSNKDVVEPFVNGLLFEDDSDFLNKLKACIEWVSNNEFDSDLTPTCFTKTYVESRINNLFNDSYEK